MTDAMTTPPAVPGDGHGHGPRQEPADAPPGGDEPLNVLLLALMERLKGAVLRSAERLGLTLPQVLVLRSATEPVPMGALAEELHYDASSITAIVDRLEQRGLVERSADPDDRRVRLVGVTREGRAVREQLEATLFDDVLGASRLDPVEERQLVELLARLLGAAQS